MPYYHVIGRDHPGEPERRLAAREAHLAMAEQLKAEGTMLLGGALLDTDGNMFGSMLVIRADNREALDHILAADPYIKEGVFQDMEITEYRPAPFFT
ncbi:MAG: YciI family protein [Pseudomonadota bacterium]